MQFIIMRVVLLFVVLFSVQARESFSEKEIQQASARWKRLRLQATATPTPKPPTPKPTTQKPTTKPPKRATRIDLPNQIIGSDQVVYFHTRNELNIEIKKTGTGSTPTGNVSFYKNNNLLGSRSLANGKAVYIISNTLNQFQGLKSIKIGYSGDQTYAAKTEVFQLFFFTLPKNGNYLVNVAQATARKTVTFWNAQKRVWNLQNKIPTNIDFYGWAKPTSTYACGTKFNVRNSAQNREIYDFTGVIGIKTIGTQGIASSSNIKKIVIVDTRGSAAGKGKVVASFCSPVL